jgi:soluble lytic murein transglycosylase-like protein
MRNVALAAAVLLVLTGYVEAGQCRASWYGVIPAIIHVESRGDPHARGAAGEIGLMQIKCSTARELGFAGKCGTLYDAKTNITWGTRYFLAALERSRCDIPTAISRYQKGLYSRFRGCSSYCRKVLNAMH